MNKFATTIENPILTTSIPDSYAYLNALRTHDSKPVYYKRLGSFKGKNGGIIDGYMLRYEEAGIEHSVRVYIDPYATENSKEAPEGLQFYYDDPAIQKLIKLAEQGNVEAQNELGYLYFNGEGVPQNDYEAFEWFQKAAKQEFPESYFYLGLLYSDGKVVPQDYAEALKWYKLAAENGEVAAETNIGLMYSKGRGVKQNYAEAVKWYRKAAEKGYAIAQNNLGEMYANGRGVNQDLNEAVKWFKLAAEQGFKQAQIALEFFKLKMEQKELKERL